jgi:acetylglutamate kinase
MSEVRPIILQLLKSLGRNNEVEQYLRFFGQLDRQRFAVVSIAYDTLVQTLEVTADALAFLHSVGLYPIVVHGAATAVPSATLVAALEGRGCAARAVSGKVFSGVALPDDPLRGRITTIDSSELEILVAAGRVPVIAARAEGPSGRQLSVGAEDASVALARVLAPRKLIVLTPAGGIVDADGNVLSAINLEEDGDRLLSDPSLSPSERRRLTTLKELLDVLPQECSVSLTHPDQLARELFTHRGAGTLVRRGERVARYESFADVDRQELRNLLERCFGKKLAHDYFERNVCDQIYVTEGYRATAILTRPAAVPNVPYLDKLAVTDKAQGEGLGSSLWRRMRRDNPRLFWRARRDNAARRWYFEQAHGSFKGDDWIVFWCGLRDHDDIKRCIEAAISLPPTFDA